MRSIHPLRVGVEVCALHAFRAGIARYLVAMLTQMMTLAPDVEFILYAPRPLALHLPDGGWRLRTDSGPCSRFANIWLQERLPAWLAEDRIDVFWGQNHFLPLRLRRPCRRVLTIHDLTAVLLPLSMPFRTRVTGRLLLRKAVRAADSVAAVSRATASQVVRRLGVDREKVTVIHNGVDAALAPVPQTRAVELVAREYGLPAKYLLCVGTIEPRKGHTVLLKALESVPDAPLLVLVGGVGWRCRDVVGRIRTFEAAGRVRHLGWVDDNNLAALYSAATVMVYPSFYEGFGLPVLEAMACGCPVLCSWSSSLPEVGGDAVRYFRPRDSGDLACRLRELVEDSVTLAEMSARGRLRAREFSYRTAAEQMLSLMRGVMCKTPGHA